MRKLYLKVEFCIKMEISDQRFQHEKKPVQVSWSTGHYRRSGRLSEPSTTQLGTFSSQGPPLASLVLVPFTTVCTHSIALPLTECAPLFAHVPGGEGGEMAIAAPALWSFSNRATTGFLEFASRFWIVVERVCGPSLGQSSGEIVGSSHAVWVCNYQGHGVRSWQKWGAAGTVKGSVAKGLHV